MKYLFIGGELDGQRIERGDNIIAWNGYNKMCIAIDETKADDVILHVFVHVDLKPYQVMWRLVNNYKSKREFTDAEISKFEYDYKVISGGKNINKQAMLYALREFVGWIEPK